MRGGSTKTKIVHQTVNSIMNKDKKVEAIEYLAIEKKGIK